MESEPTAFCRKPTFFTSSIGRKVLMAFTGIGLTLFVILHLLGNLQIFLGSDTFNHYAELLRSMPGLLWTARIGLFLIFLAHLASALQLNRINRSARPISYIYENSVQLTFASKTMFWTGLIIFLYVIGHLLHFTFGFIHPQYFGILDHNGQRDVYHMVVRGFQNRLTSILYILAMLIVGVHLSHGISSVFQTLGISHPKVNRTVRSLAPIFAWLIVLGYVVIPLAVLLGFVALQSPTVAPLTGAVSGGAHP